MNLVPDPVFTWILTILTGGFAGIWVIHDLIFLARTRGKDGRSASVRDQRFGYVMGMIIGLIGVTGVLYHHLG